MTSLALLQLVSPALPVGAFSYSEGLEVLIQAGSIADEQAIQAWFCLLYTSPSPRDKSSSRMPSSA